MKIIGREAERRKLQEYYEANEPDFLVVHGRRRIGKTYLIREFFEDRFCFYTTGLARGTKREQLANFNRALNRYGNKLYPPASTWLEAFAQLQELVEACNTKDKKVIFLDEMPWMDTKRSQFIVGLEAFWNGWASGKPEVLLIACGSSAAWIARKLFRNTAGLYNRVTRRIQLKPFTLRECEQYFHERGIVYSKQQMVESYMVFGGIPYYLSLMERRLGFAQNVDALCFARDAPLKNEFDELYHSLFREPEHYLEVIEAIEKRNRGLYRSEIIAATRLSDGGTLSKVLDDLEMSGFIRRYHSYGKSERDSLYQLTDPFSHFALKFLRGASAVHDESYWTNAEGTPARNNWKGYAFEQVCLAHVPQIKQALGIAGVVTQVYSWAGERGGKKTQIDLVIERRDNAFNMCEAKYSSSEFEISKEYSERLRRRRWAFEEAIGKRKSVFSTFITPYGVKRNLHWSESVQSEVTMDDLFT